MLYKTAQYMRYSSSSYGVITAILLKLVSLKSVNYINNRTCTKRLFYYCHFIFANYQLFVHLQKVVEEKKNWHIHEEIIVIIQKSYFVGIIKVSSKLCPRTKPAVLESQHY